jgi:pimeloyl-ACP methyl ester carboxylesterase
VSRGNLLLLHGALGSKSQFSSLIPLLEEKFHIHTLDFEGHGSSALRDRAFRDEHFAENVLDYLNENSIQSISVFGYSMGGHVGLYLARKHPERIHRIFTLATKFLWTPEDIDREASFLDAEKILKRAPHFAEVLQDRHAVSGWKNVLQRTREMFYEFRESNTLPIEELHQIGHVVRIGLGDRDSMVNIEESVQVYRSLPQGELEVFPNTPHPLEKVPVSHLVSSMVGFFG